MAATTTTAYTSAVTVRRSRSSVERLTSKAPLPRRVRADGLVEVLHREVRPQHRRGPHLRVGHLPQQEVRDTKLATGADEQIGVWMTRCVQARGDGGLIDLIRLHAVAH